LLTLVGSVWYLVLREAYKEPRLNYNPLSAHFGQELSPREREKQALKMSRQRVRQ